jgi:hypothetical protein
VTRTSVVYHPRNSEILIMPRTNIAHTLGELEKLVESVTPEDRAGVPAIGPAYEKLQKYVKRIHKLITLRDFHEARKQEATRELQELLEVARKAATVVRVGLKEDMGHDNEELQRFHIKPLRAQTRRKKSGETPEEQGSPPSEDSST